MIVQNWVSTLKSCGYSKKLNPGHFSRLWPESAHFSAHFWRKTAPRALKFAPCAESHLQPRFRALTVSKRGRSSPSYCVVSHPRAANLSTRQLGPACSVRVDLSCQPGIRIHPLCPNITHSKVRGPRGSLRRIWRSAPSFLKTPLSVQLNLRRPSRAEVACGHATPIITP